MPYTAPTVNYCATISGTYTSLTGIQSVSINRGRQRFQDDFIQSNCTVEIIPAANYVLPLAIGQFLDVRDTNASGSTCYFQGVVTDIQRQYAIPYNSGTGEAPADRITITASGATGSLGRYFLENFVLVANDPVNISITNIFLQAKIEILAQITTPTRNSAQTVSGSALELINYLLRTEQYYLDDIDNNRAVSATFLLFANRFPPGQGNTSYTFSDAGTVGAFKFVDLQYLNSVQNSFTQVQVVTNGLATQTASIGNAPYNSLVYNAYSASTGDALNLANYVLNMQSGTVVAPFSITTNTNVASTCTAVSALSTESNLDAGIRGMNLGAAVTVIFRGTTVTSSIQGINTTFYPDYATVQLFLSPSLGTPFTLDSSAFGVLDTNRLGYS
jgi:hypothetical protein